MKREMEKKEYKPVTPFGVAVSLSGFNRVCPRCYQRWSNEKEWKMAVSHSETVTRRVETKIRVGEGKQAVEKKAVAVLSIPSYEHLGCGGQMLSNKANRMSIEQ